ncbi:MAG: methyltransferase [Rhodospirillaceae bacterium]|nr:methyltransferase [Rhodospirillales bacterium]MBT3905035.1 methyltransferase [Rhodospirillaceae bacterium]MBT4700297.1 methyltransferase [Rhodospirillaceae bacterium]MBT5034157.1 methyltransferase [Rhodospirillaceae bacterium]MBT6220849.1 methyltransferase [Rhodospirillaceae bacterium]
MPEQGTVEADLTYCVDTGVKPVNETFGEGNVERKYTGTFSSHKMAISDGRKVRDQFSLEVHGFELVDHETQVKNFLDEDEIKSVYYPEVEQLIKDQTGASRVVIFDHTVRIGDEEKQLAHQVREPVLRVHNDYTDWSGPQRVRDLLPPDEADELLKHRFAIVQVWRPIQDVLKTNPLAIADSRSLETSDLIVSERRYPDRVGQTYQITHNPDHEWFYFPNMTRNEAIVFKVYESETDGRARYTAHTSFNDPTTPAGAPPRESIEMRTLAFFAPN